MALWNTLSNAVSQNAKKYGIVRFSKDQTDAHYDSEPFSEGESYCRIWLVEMCLEKGVEWFKKRYPVVHSAVRFLYADQEVTAPYIADPGFLKDLAKSHFDQILQLNHPITPLFPYQHGLVSLQSGLFSMIAADWVDRFVKTLGRFSKMLPVSEFSSVANLAEPICSGIEDMLGVGDARLELGLQQTFTGTDGGGNRLAPGYFAVVKAEPETVSKMKFKIAQDRLCIVEKDKQNKDILTPLAGYSYMLFRIEKRSEQKWESLTQIRKLADAAKAAANKNETKELNTIMENIKIAVVTSPDITSAHRVKLWNNIKAAVHESRLHGGSAAGEGLSLYGIMQQDRAISRESETEIKALERILQNQIV